MALVDAGDQRLLSFRLARQTLFQHLDDVARRKQFQARLMRGALLGDEQHRQHHHGGMVVPCPPAQRLIIGQAALALGIFESALDPIALPLHLRETQQGRLGQSIGKGVFDGLARCLLPAGENPRINGGEPVPRWAGRPIRAKTYAKERRFRQISYDFAAIGPNPTDSILMTA